MSEFMFGMRRMLGLTSPQEEEDFAQRQEMVRHEAMRGSQVQPGSVLRERQELLDSTMQQMRPQAAPVSVPVPVTPPPAQDFSAPRYGESVAPAMDALKGYGRQGMRTNINPTPPPPRKEEEQQIKIHSNSRGVRG